MLHFFALVLIFTAYSFIGWLCESIYCSVAAGHFINRGFLNGPVCPVYGFGAMLVIWILSPLKEHDHLVLLFFAAVLLTSTLEYLTGFLLEKAFNTRYWDYSDKPFNIKGRVCLENSLLFGGMSVIAVALIHPAILKLVSLFSPVGLGITAVVLLLIYALDTALSINAMYSLNGKLDELQRVLDDITEHARAATAETKNLIQSAPILDKLDEATKSAIQRFYDSRTKIGGLLASAQRRIIRAFPHMRSLRSNESLQRVRSRIVDGVHYVSDKVSEKVPSAISSRIKKD
jgi:uncharacterized membrane protein